MALFTATTNPMIIAAPATVVSSRPYLVKRVEWLSPATVGNAAVIADLNGNILIEGVCEVALQSQILWTGPQKITFRGSSTQTASWQVSTLQSGSLIIWY